MVDTWSLKGNGITCNGDIPITITGLHTIYTEKVIDLLRLKLIKDIKEWMREHFADDEVFIHAESFDGWFDDECMIQDIINHRFAHKNNEKE